MFLSSDLNRVSDTKRLETGPLTLSPELSTCRVITVQVSVIVTQKDFSNYNSYRNGIS